MIRCAFEATASYRQQHTELLEFVNPAAAALWNMRWQVRGFLGEIPDASEEQLFGRFAEGSGLRAGNMRNVFAEGTWEEHLSRFGQMLLSSAIANYEGWSQEMVASLSLSSANASSFERLLTSAHVKPTDEQRALAVFGSDPSPITQSEFQPALRSAKHALGLGRLEKLLQAFRGYKAIRNAITHRNGVMTRDDCTTVTTASSVSAAEVGTRARPEYPSAVEGERIALSYRAAVGCTAVLLNITATVDAELAGTQACEKDILRRVRAIPELGRWQELPADDLARHRRVKYLLHLAGAPAPNDPDRAIAWLKGSGVLRF